MTFAPEFWTTHVGSMPHPTVDGLCDRLANILDVPAWPQLPKRAFQENMYVQYSSGLPRVILNEADQKITFDTTGDLSPDMEAFYARYLTEDANQFALPPDYAAGFYAMLDTLRAIPGDWIKGQVTGPISIGLTVTDQDLRAALYNEILADAFVKNAAMNVRWQIQQMRAIRPNVITFVDEPYMASFGSAFISLSREQVVVMLDEIFDAIHEENGIAGVHCCANTDWSVLLGTTVDVLNLDAYGYIENLALYPAELRAFLDRGGVIAWGLVPNNTDIFQVTADELAQRLRDGLAMICEKAGRRGIRIEPAEFATRSLITPACGLGPASIEVAEKTLETLARTGEILRAG